jgi:hypothetical protein
MLSRMHLRRNKSASLTRHLGFLSRWPHRDDRSFSHSRPSLTSEEEWCLPQIKMQGIFCVIHRYIQADKLPEKVSENDVFNYKAQRWLWNESDQLRRRYLELGLQVLVKVAENAMGSDANCVEITRLPEGNFNKTFLVTMHDGDQLIARLPNPNAGRAHYTTASKLRLWTMYASFTCHTHLEMILC